jgi:glycosyltransferase involved in cell wall biosynthesis
VSDREWSVVIPSNDADRLRRCVRSILDAHLGLPAEKIIVVDDGAREQWKEEDPAVTWVDGVKPFIYARNTNIGIRTVYRKLLDGGYHQLIYYNVVIVGDDVVVRTPGAFDLLAETAKRDKVFAVSPAIEGLVGNGDQHRRTQGAVRETRHPLCFVCVYLTSEAISKVGLLDENFVHYGGEDVDWSWRAQALGGRLLVDDRVVVRHNDEGMPSAFRSKPDIMELSKAGVEQLKVKWPEKFR